MVIFKSILILTGAGISAESGIPTFRDSNGLWHNHDIDKVATPEGFAADPDLVYQFYNERRRSLVGVKPNAAHLALAELESKFDGELLIVTQNIDGLHQAAGSKNVLEMHGSLSKARCGVCGTSVPIVDDLTSESSCTVCHASAMRPDVVWFSEMPHHLNTIDAAIKRCDVFVAIGTSGNVSPASDLVEEAWRAGCRRNIEINPKPTRGRRFTQTIELPATQGVPQFVELVLSMQAARYLREF